MNNLEKEIYTIIKDLFINEINQNIGNEYYNYQLMIENVYQYIREDNFIFIIKELPFKTTVQQIKNIDLDCIEKKIINCLNIQNL